MNQNLKVINNNTKKLRETAMELRKVYKKTHNPIMEDLYLEIECYCDMINCHTKLLNKKLEKEK